MSRPLTASVTPAAARTRAARRPFLAPFLTPAVIAALLFAIALFAIFHYSVRAHIPGELTPGGFTLSNFVALMKPVYAGVFADTVLIQGTYQIKPDFPFASRLGLSLVYFCGSRN